MFDLEAALKEDFIKDKEYCILEINECLASYDLRTVKCIMNPMNEEFIAIVNNVGKILKVIKLDKENINKIVEAINGDCLKNYLFMNNDLIHNK